ncbi:MAG: anti-sigma factor [Chloroflexota bacterium]
MTEMTHSQVEELAGAFALGAVDPDEDSAVRDHLADCGEAHPEVEAAIGAGIVMAENLEPAAPSAGLRDRLMATIERTPQRVAPAAAPGPATRDVARRGWLEWLSPQLARPLAVAAVVAVVSVGAWNISLQSQLGQRDTALRAVANAIAGGAAAFRVEGDAGRGYVVDTPGAGAALVVTNLAALPADQLYELWLIDAAGTPVAVGTFTSTDGEVAVVPVERDLTGYAVFAVTVEAERIAAPSGTPVMAGELGAG